MEPMGQNGSQRKKQLIRARQHNPAIYMPGKVRKPDKVQ